MKRLIPKSASPAKDHFKVRERLLEIGGTTPGLEYDQLHVTGDLMMDGQVLLDFIDGFAPSMGDVFDLLLADGELQSMGFTIGIQGLQDGFEYDFAKTDAGELRLVALNDGISTSNVPEPTTLLIWLGLGPYFCVARRWRFCRLPNRLTL